MPTSNATYTYVETFKGSQHQDKWYLAQLKLNNNNLRLSRNLQHALKVLFLYVEGKQSITINYDSMWFITVIVNKEALMLRGLFLPSLVCEAALKVKELQLQPTLEREYS